MMLSRILNHELTKESRYWSTFNAYSNNYMIAINDELEYKENAIYSQFEIEKRKLEEYLNKE